MEPGRSGVPPVGSGRSGNAKSYSCSSAHGLNVPGHHMRYIAQHYGQYTSHTSSSTYSTESTSPTNTGSPSTTTSNSSRGRYVLYSSRLAFLLKVKHRPASCEYCHEKHRLCVWTTSEQQCGRCRRNGLVCIPRPRITPARSQSSQM
jgi:hypothetical protein